MSRWRKSHEQGPNAGKSLVCSKLKIRPYKSGKTESRLVVTLGEVGGKWEVIASGYQIWRECSTFDCGDDYTTL